MHPFPPQKFNPLGFTFGLLMFLGFVAFIFASDLTSNQSTLYKLIRCVYIILLGLYLLYTGMKKLHQRREQQEQVHWYIQPGILFAMAVFFYLPYSLFALFVSEATLNALPTPIKTTLFTPTGICILAAIFFYFRG